MSFELGTHPDGVTSVVIQTPPVYPLVANKVYAKYENSSEAGYIIKSPRYTKPKWDFTLNFKYLKRPEKETLDGLYSATLGGTIPFSFKFIENKDGQVIDILTTELNMPSTFKAYIMDYTAELAAYTYWNVTLKLQEA